MCTIKIHLNSVISTPGAGYMNIDLKDLYINHVLLGPEFMCIPIWAIPKIIMDNYNLWHLVHNGYLTCRIDKAMYGLPQAGCIAYDNLVAQLLPHGYYPAPHTPGLWLHKTRPITFTLVVDDFGVKYTDVNDVHHLIAALKENYELTEDWTGSLYTGITLDWDYENGTVDLSILGYYEKALRRFQHNAPAVPEDAPHAWMLPSYGAAVQYAEDADTSTPISDAQKKRVQEIIGTFLFAARAVDPTLLVALGSIATQQANCTEKTMKAITHLLNYVATHPEPMICFKCSDMKLEIATDSSYLSETKSPSRAGGYHYLSNLRPARPILPEDPLPMMNGPVHVHCSIMAMIVSSAAEAETGGAYNNGKDAIPLRIALKEMGHPQPATPIECDNTTAVGIVNDPLRQRRSKAMDMRFYWIKDQQQQGQFQLYWHPGSTNRSDYFTKHHSPAHHRIMRQQYIHSPTAAEYTSKKLLRGKQQYTVASLIEDIRGLLLEGSWRGCVDPSTDPGYQDPRLGTQTLGLPFLNPHKL
jgi:hypothetical protein